MSKFRLDVYPPKGYTIWIDGLMYASQPKTPLTLKEWAAKTGADIVYPLAMYNMSHGTDRFGPIYGRTIQYVRGGGRDIGYGGTEYVLGLNPCEQMYGANSGGTHKDACSGYRTAIVSGVIVPGLDHKIKRSHNANGMMKNGDYFHLLTETDATEAECAAYMKGQGALFMLMQDGGGATGKFFDGSLVFAPEKEGPDGRPTCSVVCLRRISPPAAEKEGKKPAKKTVYLSNAGPETGVNGSGALRERKERILEAAVSELKARYDVFQSEKAMTAPEAAADSNLKHSDIHIALSVDQAEEGITPAYEVFVRSEGGAEDLAGKILAQLPLFMHAQDSGVKVDNGILELRELKAPAVFLRIIVKGGTEGESWLSENTAPIGKALARGIQDFLGDPPTAAAAAEKPKDTISVSELKKSGIKYIEL